MSLWRHDLACREFVDLVTEYLEGALPRRDVRRVRRHLAGCDGCSNYLEQVQLTVHALRTIPADPVPDPLIESVTVALREQGAR
jgi:anti-sigma factor RsiW